MLFQAFLCKLCFAMHRVSFVYNQYVIKLLVEEWLIRVSFRFCLHSLSLAIQIYNSMNIGPTCLGKPENPKSKLPRQFSREA